MIASSQRNNDYDEATEAYVAAWKVLGEGEYEVVIKALEYYISEKKYTKALVIIQDQLEFMRGKGKMDGLMKRNKGRIDKMMNMDF